MKSPLFAGTHTVLNFLFSHDQGQQNTDINSIINNAPRIQFKTDCFQTLTIATMCVFLRSACVLRRI